MTNNTEKIYQNLKERIVNVEIPPNSLIKEESLCNEYKMSRSPIRYVISRLVQEGLLIVRSKKGTYVSKISYKGIQNNTFIRKAVETMVIKECCNKIKANDRKYIEEILAEQEKICELEPSIQKSQLFNIADNNFHSFLFKIAGYESLWNELQKSTVNFDRVRVMSNLRSKEEVKVTYNHHCKIYKYICSKKPEEAISVFQEHLDLAFNEFENVVAKYESYFDKE